MIKKLLAAGLAALSLTAGAAAHAACFTRPGTPNQVRAVPKPGHERDTIEFHWWDTTRNGELVWHDFEITDGSGRLVQSLTGVGYGSKSTVRDFGGLTPNTTRCFRIKARTEAGTNGCVSKLWSARVCATTASAPGTPGPGTSGQGKWGALAADGRGHWGYAVNFKTETQARDAAKKSCGDGRCTVKIAAQVGCYAYFESRSNGYWYGLALHSSGATATQVARSGCEKGAPAGTCKLVKASCGS